MKIGETKARRKSHTVTKETFCARELDTRSFLLHYAETQDLPLDVDDVDDVGMVRFARKCSYC